MILFLLAQIIFMSPLLGCQFMDPLICTSSCSSQIRSLMPKHSWSSSFILIYFKRHCLYIHLQVSSSPASCFPGGLQQQFSVGTWPKSNVSRLAMIWQRWIFLMNNLVVRFSDCVYLTKLNTTLTISSTVSMALWFVFLDRTEGFGVT